MPVITVASSLPDGENTVARTWFGTLLKPDTWPRATDTISPVVPPNVYASTSPATAIVVCTPSPSANTTASRLTGETPSTPTP